MADLNSGDHRRRHRRPLPGARPEAGRHKATVYERDRTSTDGLQGYRVQSARRQPSPPRCLPPELFETFIATCGRPPRAFRMMTERMQKLISLGGFGNADGDPVEQHARSAGSRCARCCSRASRTACNSTRRSPATEHRRSRRGILRGRQQRGGRRAGGGRRRRLARAPAVLATRRAGRYRCGSHRRQGVPGLRDAPPHPTTAARCDGSGLGARRAWAVRCPAGIRPHGRGGRHRRRRAGGRSRGHTLFDNTRSYLMWAFGAQRHVLGLTPRMCHAQRRCAASRSPAWRTGMRATANSSALTDPGTLSLLPIRTSRPVASMAAQPRHAARRCNPQHDAVSWHRRQHRPARRRPDLSSPGAGGPWRGDAAGSDRRVRTRMRR